jgi:hypothetical protein
VEKESANITGNRKFFTRDLEIFACKRAAAAVVTAAAANNSRFYTLVLIDLPLTSHISSSAASMDELKRADGYQVLLYESSGSTLFYLVLFQPCRQERNGC